MMQNKMQVAKNTCNPGTDIIAWSDIISFYA